MSIPSSQDHITVLIDAIRLPPGTLSPPEITPALITLTRSTSTICFRTFCCLFHIWGHFHTRLTKLCTVSIKLTTDHFVLFGGLFAISAVEPHRMQIGRSHCWSTRTHDQHLATISKLPSFPKCSSVTPSHGYTVLTRGIFQWKTFHKATVTH